MDAVRLQLGPPNYTTDRMLERPTPQNGLSDIRNERVVTSLRCPKSCRWTGEPFQLRLLLGLQFGPEQPGDHGLLVSLGASANGKDRGTLFTHQNVPEFAKALVAGASTDPRSSTVLQIFPAVAEIARTQ